MIIIIIEKKKKKKEISKNLTPVRPVERIEI